VTISDSDSRLLATASNPHYQRTRNAGIEMHRRILTISIAAVLSAFIAVPIGLNLYGGGAAAFGGLAIIASLITLQLPVFLVLKRLGWIPKVDRDDTSENR
jgi:hypothetical protein